MCLKLFHLCFDHRSHLNICYHLLALTLTHNLCSNTPLDHLMIWIPYLKALQVSRKSPLLVTQAPNNHSSAFFNVCGADRRHSSDRLTAQSSQAVIKAETPTSGFNPPIRQDLDFPNSTARLPGSKCLRTSANLDWPQCAELKGGLCAHLPA